MQALNLQKSFTSTITNDIDLMSSNTAKQSKGKGFPAKFLEKTEREVEMTASIACTANQIVIMSYYKLIQLLIQVIEQLCKNPMFS